MSLQSLCTVYRLKIGWCRTIKEGNNTNQRAEERYLEYRFNTAKVLNECYYGPNTVL